MRYRINMKTKTISYDELLELFKIGYMVDETMFIFKSDPHEGEHYLGYIAEYPEPYWAGYCDIEDGCEFKTAEELFNAPIYDGKSIKERWDDIEIINIGGIYIDDWYRYVKK